MSKISYPHNIGLWKFIYSQPNNLCRSCQLLLWIKNFVENLSTLPVIIDWRLIFMRIQEADRKERDSAVNFFVFLCKS